MINSPRLVCLEFRPICSAFWPYLRICVILEVITLSSCQMSSRRVSKARLEAKDLLSTETIQLAEYKLKCQQTKMGSYLDT